MSAKSNKELPNYDIHCNKIGNLTIVFCRDNSAMKDHSFDKKKTYLKQSKHIKLNNDILFETIKDENGNEKEIERQDWTVESISSITEKMIDLINKEYKYSIASIDKKLAYYIQFNKDKSKMKYQVTAKIYNGGDIIFHDDCVVMYKSSSSYLSKQNILDALNKVFFIKNSDKTVTLKKDSKFESLEVLSEVIMGDLTKEFKNSWIALNNDKTVNDLIGIDNVLSALLK